MILVKNPHSIFAALKNRPEEVDAVVVPDQATGVWSDIQMLATRHRKLVSGLPAGGGETSRRGGKSEHGHRSQLGGRQSGHGAILRPKSSADLGSLLGARSHKFRLVLILDCIQDPQNLGSIFRTAAFYGVSGIIMTSERSAPLTSVVYDVSSGGVEVVPFAEVINLKQALEKLKKADFWIMGTSDKTKDDISAYSRDRNWAVVFGNEETGMRRLTQESCDVLVKIGGASEFVSSLNVSVAVGSALERMRS